MSTPKKKRNYTIKDWVTGDISGLVADNLSFIIFLAFLAMIYIGNAHYGERRVRQIHKLKEDVQRLNWEYMSIKSELMQKSIESEMKKMLAPAGVKELESPPYTVDADEALLESINATKKEEKNKK